MDVHNRLKKKTQTYHAQIEQTPLLNRMMNTSIDMAGYHLLLEQFHAYICPCENIIRSSPWSPLLKNREKTNLLSNDFLDLGIDINTKNCLNLPPLTIKEEILGYLYVIEGATLGGQVIAEVLKKKLGLSSKHGARYFNGYCNKSAIMWIKFCHVLNQANPIQEQQILISASRTYTTLIDWLSQE